jgi:hypothetical protein
LRVPTYRTSNARFLLISRCTPNDVECVYGVLMFGSNRSSSSVMTGDSGYTGVFAKDGTALTPAESRKSSGSGPRLPSVVFRLAVIAIPGLLPNTPEKSPMPFRL